MSRDERRRLELFELLAPTLGREATVQLLDTLPPAGQPLATAAQVDRLEKQMDDRFAAVDQRMTDRFTALGQRMDDRMAGLRDELLAAFRGELVTAVSGQTRAVIIATATATFGIGGLAVTLAQLLS